MTGTRTARRTACAAAPLLTSTALPTSAAAATATPHVEGRLPSGAPNPAQKGPQAPDSRAPAADSTPPTRSVPSHPTPYPRPYALARPAGGR